MITKFAIIESTILNSCFLILLITTIYYWSKIIFFSSFDFETIVANVPLQQKFNWTASLNNANQNSSSADALASATEMHPKRLFNLGFLALMLVNILLTISLIGRWVDSGHFPLSGLYESLVFLSWAIIFFYLIIEYRSKTEFIGTLITPILLCILGFTGFSLPIELQATKPLVPALQSNWLFMHVSVMMLSYAALILGCLLSIFYILVFFFLQKNKNTIFEKPLNVFSSNNTQRNFNEIEKLTLENSFNSNITDPIQLRAQPQEKLENIPTSFESVDSLQVDQLAALASANNSFIFCNLLENFSYRLIGIGFCFLTLGILSGAVWANETWGSYWSWDPKETWALITWLTFAIYLHTRILQGWKGLKSAVIASFGFFIIWFCYLGVNLLGKGLHSYGFFN